MPAGRPSKYTEAYADTAAKLCRLGATDVELADFFAVDIATIYRWKLVHEEFCEALKVGKEAADERVAKSLYHKAIGYEHDAVKIFQNAGEPVIVPYREHVPPSDTAAIFWLKNRRPDEWRDRKELTGKDGADLIPEVDDVELAQRIAALLIAGTTGGDTEASD